MPENEQLLISEQEINEVKEKSPDKLPLNPTAQGYTGAQVRARLAKFITDDEKSVISIIKNKMALIKARFDFIDSYLNQVLDLNTLKLNPDSGLTQEDIVNIAEMFYDIENHTFSFKTDFGDFHEIGHGLGVFGSNPTQDTWIGQPIVIVGGHEIINDKKFVYASAGVQELSSPLAIVSSSNNEDGRLSAGSVARLTTFGDVIIKDWSKVLDSTFLADLGLESYSSIQTGTKLYLSVELGKYSAVLPPRPYAGICVAQVVFASEDNLTGKIFVYPHQERTGSSASVLITEEDDPEGLIENDFYIVLEP